MGMLNHQIGKNPVKVQTMDPILENKGLFKIESISPTEKVGDSLISFNQYIKAIKNLKSLYKTILPRQLTFKDILFDTISPK
jgi:hypothetical protein